LFTDVCILPPDQGPCNGFDIRYYYNPVSRTCEQFRYGGCKGNGNNFLSASECQTECFGGRIPFPIYGLDFIAEMCSRPVDSGPCRGNFRRWYYNSRTLSCERFTYGGCGGNDNNFDSEEQCEDICIKQFQNSGGSQPSKLRNGFMLNSLLGLSSCIGLAIYMVGP
uniref:BPTI/Kunitz inhibitor domain-containing protein n=1 Tax=Soboliphyme baturini TaxID=241478 RepID=A0A183J4B9_9BILA